MDTASQQPSARKAASSPPQGSTPPLWMTLVPILCIVATFAFWWQTRSELGLLRLELRELTDTIHGVSTIDVSSDPALGSDSAVVTLIEFSDYECPFCIRHFVRTMPEIDQQYIRTGRIRYVFKDFPIDQLHPEAIHGHEASRCAGEQGKFWEMHMKMFGPPGTHTAEALETHATEIGLALPLFQECLESDRFVAGIRETADLAVRLGANGTPAFFIGLRDPGTNRVRVVRSISGAQPFSVFEQAIAAAEEQARKER